MLRLRANNCLISGKFEKDILVIVDGGEIISLQNYTNQDYDIHSHYIVPGFIDNHTHGGFGHDFMEANVEAYKNILTGMANNGTTSVVATSITQSQDKIFKMLKFASEYEGDKNETKIIGIHLEGPYINTDKSGAQPVGHILTPMSGDIENLQNVANGKILCATYAPELDNDFSFTRKLVENGIRPQIGHSVADQSIINEALRNGLAGATHVFNAMPKGKNETTGHIANTALYSEIIVDGIHNDKEKVKWFLDTHDSSKSILVTDSLMARGLDDGEYMLGGQRFTKSGLKCTLDSGTLAGSVANMVDVIRKTIEYTDLKIDQIYAMTSYNLKNYYNLEKIGDIKVGFDADICCLNTAHRLEEVIIKGERIYGN